MGINKCVGLWEIKEKAVAPFILETLFITSPEVYSRQNVCVCVCVYQSRKITEA